MSGFIYIHNHKCDKIRDLPHDVTIVSFGMYIYLHNKVQLTISVDWPIIDVISRGVSVSAQ